MNKYSMQGFCKNQKNPELIEKLQKKALEKYKRKQERMENAKLEFFTIPDFSSISGGGTLSWWFNRDKDDVTFESEDERYDKQDVIQSLRRLADYLENIETYTDEI